MPRRPRVVFPGVAHHITQRGNDRQPVFRLPEHRRLYLDLLSHYATHSGVRVLGYCLMTNHIHLVAVPAREDSLARTLGRVHSEYALALNRAEGRSGHLWQSRFYSCSLDESHLITALRYVDLNPVRAGLTAKPWDWPWSSARAHTVEHVRDAVLDSDWAAYCGPWSYDEWKELLLVGIPDDESGEVRQATQTGAPLGSREFVTQLERQAGRRLRVFPTREAQKPAKDVAGSGATRVLTRRYRRLTAAKCVCPLLRPLHCDSIRYNPIYKGASMTRCTLLFSLLFAILTASGGRAQSTPPAFDVASIKLQANCQMPPPRLSFSPRNLVLPCASLRSLIRMAYGDILVGSGIGARRVEAEGGPAWLDTELYDIFAKSEGNTTQSAAPMLRTLLEERFKLSVHKEARNTDVYILTVANSGPKLLASKEGSCTQIDMNDLQAAMPKPGEPRPKYCGMSAGKRNGSQMIYDWYGVSLAEFAGRGLTNYVDLPVVDQTRLPDRYDIHIEFVPESRASGPIMLNGVPVPDSPAQTGVLMGPTIFSALEKQLGLKLSRGKAPLDVIIVDHAEKPTAN